MTREIGATTLRENFRARDSWARDAWNELREGKALQAVARLERRRRIVISLTRGQSRDAAVDQWDRDRRDGAARGRGIEQYLLLTDTSNTDVDLLNAAAQDRRLRAGELGGTAIEVRAPRDDGGVRQERLYAGDSVSFTRQVYFGPWRPRVENGATGVITLIHADGAAVDVQLPDRTVTIRGDDLPALRLGYAQHVYRAQGRTVDRIYGVTGGWQTARETSYVGSAVHARPPSSTRTSRRSTWRHTIARPRCGSLWPGRLRAGRRSRRWAGSSTRRRCENSDARPSWPPGVRRGSVSRPRFAGAARRPGTMRERVEPRARRSSAALRRASSVANGSGRAADLTGFRRAQPADD